MFPGPGPGRPKGLPNKATTKAREAIANLVDGNIDKVQTWLDEIYTAKGPEAAMNAFTGLIEYHVPKLARTVVAGDSEAPIAHSVKVELVRANQPTDT